jgi:hypothetical protein
MRKRLKPLLPAALGFLLVAVALFGGGLYLFGALALTVGPALLALIAFKLPAAGLEAAPCLGCQGRGWRLADDGHLRVCPLCQGHTCYPLDRAQLAELDEQDLELVDLIASEGGSLYDRQLFAKLGVVEFRGRDLIDLRLDQLVGCGLLKRCFKRGDESSQAEPYLYQLAAEAQDALEQERYRRERLLRPGKRQRLSPLAGPDARRAL